MSASLIGRSGVRRFQTIHHCDVDVARGLVLLSGIGTKAEYVALCFKNSGAESSFYWYVTFMCAIALVASIRIRKSKAIYKAKEPTFKPQARRELGRKLRTLEFAVCPPEIYDEIDANRWQVTGAN